jgi:choline dehydrogenase-like flavoprotein
MAPKEYDVLIIGSGHSGGMAANILTKRRLSCLMLNAGPVADLSHDRSAKAAHELPFRGFGKPGPKPHTSIANEFNKNQWVDEAEVPYTHETGARYEWTRVRLLGGRSLFWTRQCFRLSDYEFKAKDHDGYGENWPISLADLAPYYSRVEAILKVGGRNEKLPQFPDANLIDLNEGPDSLCIQRLTNAARDMGIPHSKIRLATGGNGVAGSTDLLLPEAAASGFLDMVPNAIVREITVDKKNGRVNGANFIDRHTRREMHVRSRAVVLAAGTLESTRLLLNSGIANSSGLVGRYLFDHIYGCHVVVAVPEASFGKPKQGIMGGNMIVPRFRNLAKGEKHSFIRGYALAIYSGVNAEPNFFAAYGAELQDKLDAYCGACVLGSIAGEVLPRYKNHVRINKDVVDAWGIPALHIDAKYTDNELNMARDAANVQEELFKSAGFDLLAKSDKALPPGASLHELGTCRMGNDPKSSVLNKFNQSHDLKNLFVVDGAAFVSGGWQNPTLTILALSMRASEYLAEQGRLNNI